MRERLQKLWIQMKNVVEEVKTDATKRTQVAVIGLAGLLILVILLPYIRLFIPGLLLILILGAIIAAFAFLLHKLLGEKALLIVVVICAITLVALWRVMETFAPEFFILTRHTYLIDLAIFGGIIVGINFVLATLLLDFDKRKSLFFLAPIFLILLGVISLFVLTNPERPINMYRNPALLPHEREEGIISWSVCDTNDTYDECRPRTFATTNVLIPTSLREIYN